MNDKLRKEFKKPKINKEFVSNVVKKERDTLAPSIDSFFDPAYEEEINETKRKTKEA
jgi:predicted outer membrane protein